MARAAARRATSPSVVRAVTAGHSRSRERTALRVAAPERRRDRLAAAIAALVSANVIHDVASGASLDQRSRTDAVPTSVRNSFVNAEVSK
jgi:hypothetical protein